MALTLTNTTLSSTIVKSELQDNFTDIVNKFGSIDNSDIASDAAIATTKLAANDYEFLVHFSIILADITASTTVPSVFVSIPGTSSDGTYTVLSGSWLCTDCGDSNDQDFTITWGNFAADGATWGVTTTIATETDLTGLGGANTAGHGTLTISGATLTLEASAPMFIGVNFPNATGTSVLDDAAQKLEITLKLRRTDGLR